MIDEIQSIIDRIIREHKVLLQDMDRVDKVANDAQAIAAVEKAQKTFMPGINAAKTGLKDLEKLFNTADEGVRAHFNFEETALLGIIQKHGHRDTATLLFSLLMDHYELRERFTRSKSEIDDLINGKLDRHVWEAKAYDMRAHISHTRTLLESHARAEQEMFRELLDKVQVAKAEGTKQE